MKQIGAPSPYTSTRHVVVQQRPADASLSELEQIFVDAYLFRLGASVSALVEEAMEPVLLAGGQMLFLDSSEDLQSLEYLGAIPSADQLLSLRERVGQHYRLLLSGFLEMALLANGGATLSREAG